MNHIPCDLAGIRAIEAKPVAFPDLLPEIKLLFRALARRKGIEFAIEIDANVPRYRHRPAAPARAAAQPDRRRLRVHP